MPDIVLRLYLTLMRLTDLTMVKTAKKERKISKTLYYVEGMDMSLGQLRVTEWEELGEERGRCANFLTAIIFCGPDNLFFLLPSFLFTCHRLVR
jgi:hypothetical protein